MPLELTPKRDRGAALLHHLLLHFSSLSDVETSSPLLFSGDQRPAPQPKSSPPSLLSLLLKLPLCSKLGRTKSSSSAVGIIIIYVILFLHLSSTTPLTPFFSIAALSHHASEGALRPSLPLSDSLSPSTNHYRRSLSDPDPVQALSPSGNPRLEKGLRVSFGPDPKPFEEIVGIGLSAVKFVVGF